MKSALVSFGNKYFSQGLFQESKAVMFLNQHSIFLYRVFVVDKEDKEYFLQILSSDFEAVYLVGGENCSFKLDELLKSNGIELDGDGFFSGNKFIANLTENSFLNGEKLISAVEKHFGKYYDKLVFKLFGIDQQTVEKTTSEISAKYPAASFFNHTEALETKTVLLYDSKAPKVELDKAVREFLLELKDYVYAEDDVPLNQRLSDLLRLRRLKISTAESMTGGAIASQIVKIAGASDLFYEGLVTYNTEAKETRLGVSHSSVITYGVVSSQIAYEMARGVLQTGKADVAISITGYAGQTRDNSGKPEGLCYIGIGLFQTVDVFSYNFVGTREEVIKMATNAALFQTIKKLNNI